MIDDSNLDVALVSAAQIAEACSVSVKTIRRWHERGIMPPPKRFGRRLLRWDKNEIENWIQQEGEPNERVTID